MKNERKTTETVEVDGNVGNVETDGIDEIKSGRYRHFKGREYEVIGTATHSETLQKYVVYRALYGEKKLWVRPAKMWSEQVEVEGKKVPRFEYISQE